MVGVINKCTVPAYKSKFPVYMGREVITFRFLEVQYYSSVVVGLLEPQPPSWCEIPTA